MKRLRIMLVTGEYPPQCGGIGDYTVMLREALRDRGVDSLVVTRGRRDESDVVPIDDWGWRAIGRIRTVAREREVDIVHIQYQSGAFDMRAVINLLPTMLRRLSNLRIVTTFHDLRVPYLFPKAGRVRQFAVLRMARASDAVVVTNPTDERVLAGAGIACHRVPIGPNLPPPRMGADDADTSTVAFFGFPSRSKGIIELIDAVGLMPADSRPRLLLIGAQGLPSPSNDVLPTEEIDDHARSVSVAVDRTGYLVAQEASDSLARAGAVALPFRTGASLRSGSLLAALQSGCPVVTTAPARAETLGSLTALPQLRLALPHDIESLRDEICSALSSRVHFSPLPSEFTWPSIATQHLKLYRSLVGESSS